MLFHVVREQMGLTVAGQGLALGADDEAGVVDAAVPFLRDAAAHDGDCGLLGQTAQQVQGRGLIQGRQLGHFLQGIARVPQLRQQDQLRAPVDGLAQQLFRPGHIVLYLGRQNIELDSGGFDPHRPISSLNSSNSCMVW